MLIFDIKNLLINYLNTFFNKKSNIGFVPTMGALHAGHLSLLKKSISENEVTVISIFVNPTQFNNTDDLKKYPRTLLADIEKIGSVSDQIIVFTPTVEEIYGEKTESKSYNFDGLEHQMEGKFRPGHFDGVGTVVQRLFEIVKPTNAYFGEKDFQQLQIIKKLVEKLQLDVTVVGCPIFREQNGLAMSSRNQRLSLQERAEAKIIFETLSNIKQLFGHKTMRNLNDIVAKTFKKNQNFTLEYFTIAEEKTLVSAKRKLTSKKYRAFIAVIINNIRLIDTVALN